MAESTLSYAFADLQAEIGHFVGFGRTTGSWSAAQTADVAAVIKRGYSRALFPKPLPGQSIAHEWSWLKPVTTLTTSAPYGTGTIAATSGVVTITGGTAPTWAASGVLLHNNHTYSINTRDSGTQVTLDDLTVSITAGASYQISQFIYDLPDSFGQLVGCLTYEPNIHHAPIAVVGEGLIRELRQLSNAATGYPCRCAIRPKAVSASVSVGQRLEILFDPAPDAAYVFTYRYTILPGKLDATVAMPYGGAAFAETILASCLAVAEETLNDVQNGPKAQAFMEQLAASIGYDSRSRPDHLPCNYDHSDGMECIRHRGQRVSYNGVFY